ncbi:hypothetical protein scyTo_0026900, partial [Scyliorhinus torazame]|nr:hypothetical protein [Scyliorhinus torazame]
FTEDTVIREEDGSGDGDFIPEKQRLIRKDTPHYKKQFKINKLPKPEAVLAMLQSVASTELRDSDQAIVSSHGLDTDMQQLEEGQEVRDERLSQPPVKVGWMQGPGTLTLGGSGGAGTATGRPVCAAA